jgi:hypothetical protein
VNRSSARFLVGSFFALLLLTPSVAFAQAAIAGVVRDTSGAVLPGVTVEAASPALIEKVRSVVTDSTGQYRIVDLRPGAYTVTFSLPGFSTVKREGIEISGLGTFQVNADMRVGALEETITVTGEAPVVDVQNARNQTVLNDDVLTALPSARNYESLHILIPGVTVLPGTGAGSGVQDVGGTSTNSLVYFTAFGSAVQDSRVLVNGVSIADVQSNGGRSMWVPNTGASQEVTVTTSSAGLGESEAAGVTVNMLFKEGGNSFSGSFFGSGATEGMASDNFSDELRAAGLRTPNRLKNVFDYEASVGGPIKRDKLWFFVNTRYHGFANWAAGMFHNRNAGNLASWTYDPDPSRPAFSDTSWKNLGLRLTWQATPRNKFSAYHDDQLRCANCSSGGSPTSSPEANGRQTAHPNNFDQLTWTSPVTNRLLLEAGGGFHILRYGGGTPYPGDPPFDPRFIQVQEQGGIIPGLTYRAVGNTAKPWIGNYAYRASLAYVSGSHALKFGGNGDFHNFTQRSNNPSDLKVTYRFNNGVPNQLTQLAHPFEYWEQLHQWGMYAQDQWTMRRLTLSGGIRFDKFTAFFPEGQVGPVRWIPVPVITPAAETTNQNDISVRGSAVYDVFGDGRTAVKVSLGKYMLQQNSHNNVLGGQAAPMNRIPISTNRSWNDANRDFVPDCDLLNRAANGECGAWANQSFGTPVFETVLDRELTHGWGVRPYNWAFEVGVQRELIPRVSANLTYYRRWYGNVPTQENRAARYTFFDLTMPNDPRLPIAGETVSGFMNVTPETFGRFDNFITHAKNYGDLIQNWHGFDLSASARGSGLTFQGGVSSGRARRDICDVARNNPSALLIGYETEVGRMPSGQAIPMEYCNMVGKWRTQVKGLAAYTVPRIDVSVAATLQNIPGQEMFATYAAPNAVVAPALGRPLAGNAANISLNLLPPQQNYSDRTNQIDLRFGKIFRFGSRRVQVTYDLYNALNSNAVQTYNPNYSPTGSWRVPTAILSSRLSKITAQFDF